ncbi:hypothetical protein CS033_04966 [Phocaeicola vulgatus]|nr:hypothetical protein [Phocaeicola vulgatus]
MEKHVRTRPHDTHIPQQHIDKLGQLIYIRLTHYIAPARLAGIMLRGLYPVGICIYFHTAELVTIKLPAVQPVPFLAEEQRAGHGQSGHYRHHNQNNRKKRTKEHR